MSEPTTNPAQPDWPVQAADAVVRYVDQVKSKTTQPAITLSKVVVVAIFGAIVGLLLAVVAMIGVFRGLDELRDLVVADSVWITYVSLGAVLVIVGQILFSKRKKVR